jgi:serine/threonine protein kinase
MTDESIFAAALAIADPGQRVAFLDQACADQPALRRQVEELLAAHDRPGQFLDQPPLEAVLTGPFLPAASPQVPEDRPDTRIGPYKLLQKIGEGGMGTVWMAEQTEPVKRLVALKIIKPGLDSANVLARFEAERQALALMDHPHIARVFDAGTTSGSRPYFVMELVKGVPITQFCDEHHLTPRQRLALFVPVCQAVQHAHTKGLIHRDLKPSNVLVALYDDKPVPKVIDFGVAKATGGKLTDRTLYTEFGAIVGTLEYMSPEQATFNALDVDTRSDVYALGVLLYELLTGSTPLERSRLKQAALDEVLRLIREEEAPPPSTRLSQSGPALRDISTRRRTEPTALTRLLQGEVDWIVLKALEKDRSHRYETANALAHDIEHYLKDEPVEACPPSIGYRLGKFSRKHRKALVTAAGFGLLLLAATAVSLWLAVQTRETAQAASANADWADRKAAEAEQKQKDTLRVKDELEGILARSLLRPLAVPRVLGGGLGGPEVEALREVATVPSDNFKLRILREAFRKPGPTRQLLLRRGFFLTAVVALDTERRACVEQMLLHRLDDPALSPDHRFDLLLIAATLGDLGPQLTRAASLGIARAYALDARYRGDILSGPFSALLARLSPREADAILETLADDLEAASAHSPAAQYVDALLKRIAPQLTPTQVARITEAIARKMSLRDATNSLPEMATAIMYLGSYLAATDGRKLAQSLVSRLEGMTGKDFFLDPRWPGKAVQALAPYFTPGEAERLTTVFADQIGRRTTGTEVRSLCSCFPTLARRLPADQAHRLCLSAADALVHSIVSEPLSVTSGESFTLLAALIPLLEPEQTRRPLAAVSAFLVRSLNDTSPTAARDIHGLVAILAPVLEPGEAGRLSEAILLKLDQLTANQIGSPLFPAALVPRLERRDAAKLADAVTRKFTAQAARDSYSAWVLCERLAELLPYLEPDHASRLASTTVALVVRHLESRAPGTSHLANGPALFARYLKPEDVLRLCTVMAPSLDSSSLYINSGFDLSLLVPRAAVLLGRLDAATARRLCAEQASALASKPKMLGNPKELADTALALAVWAMRLEPFEARRLCSAHADAIVRALAPCTDAAQGRYLCTGLAALAPFLDTAEAAHVCTIAYQHRIRKETDLSTNPLITESQSKAWATLMLDVDFQRSARAGAGLIGTTQLLPAIALLGPVQAPPPCRLSTQTLVDLLKDPLAGTFHRDVILEQLAGRYHRRFADQWEFVRFARQQGLDLDFTTPPRYGE